MTIAVNIEQGRERIKAAAEKVGRDPASIKLIAVSKTKSVTDILEAIDAGQLIFGENYAQELRDKVKQIKEMATLTPPSPIPPLQPRRAGKGEGDTVTSYNNIEWHFIGHLQKNKIKYVLPAATWIHTIDSAELLEDIAKKANPPRILNCLIEVNIANEPNKSGISPDKAFELVRAFSTIALKGLMCMPPLSDNPENSRPYFKKLKSLLDEINSRNIYPEKLTELSMGMTQDFEVAIEEGSTMVRIGTAIFGKRS